MATLLLFNIEDEEKRKAVRQLAVKLGYSFQDVPPEQQNRKISELLSGKETSRANQTPFMDEMMVMSGFQSQDMHALLDGMRNSGNTIKLKCIVTETNRSWTATRLYQELKEEEENLRRRTAKK